MRLVNHRIGHGSARRRIALPIKAGVHHHRFGHGKGAITGVKAQIRLGRPRAVAIERI